MEQNGISIITSPGIAENSIGKSNRIGIAFSPTSGVQAVKERLKGPWLTNLTREETTVWDTILIGLGEAIGTAILVFLGCMGCVGSMGVTPPITQISLTFGFAVMIAIQAVGHISGAHINPAITVAALILGNLSFLMSILYIVAQCFGAILGFGLLKALTPSTLLNAGSPETADSFCTTDLHEEIKAAQGFFAEAVATGILAFFTCGAWDARNENKSDSLGLRFSFCVTVLCFTFIPYTGCSLNPARSLGPAMWNGYWTHHWVYWLGPIFGAVIASLFYRCFFSPRSKRAEIADSMQDAGTLNGVET